jgi:tripartite-type tricarboxylate transporter receptor subunit TctC
MKKAITLFCIVLLIVSFHASAFGQVADLKAKVKSLKPKDFPTQPIEFVVVYNPGGGMDLTARVLGKYVEKYIDGRVVVINKTGGGGVIGHTYLATVAKNDGYTVGILNNALWNDSLLRVEGKWTHRDLEPLIFVNNDPRTWVVTVNGKLKDKTIKEVIEMGKKEPRTLKAGVTAGTSSEYILDAIDMEVGAKYLKVPFQGGAPAFIALLGGHIDFFMQYLPEYKSHLDSGKVKVIAVCSEERDKKNFPNIPTLNEVMGRDDLISQSWRFAAVPKGVARDRYNYLEAAIDAALHDPECIKEFETTGCPIGVKYLNAKQTIADVDKYFKMDRDFLVKTGRLPK